MAQEATKPAPAAAADILGPRIPVKALYFLKETEYPGNFSSAVVCGGALNQKRWMADFLPRVGLFELRFYPANSEKAEVRWYGTAWCSADPA